MFPENNKRVKRQRSSPIRVVIANPPYSSGQNSENDGNKNLKYPNLDERIRSTYADRSTAILKNSLYDSYVRALHWASDRIADRGIVSFVSNASFIDANAMDGLRASLTDEFTSIYVFNLRGNQRTSGETSRMEGGKIFGSGSRATIAISLFIKNPDKKGKCELFYHDIGDYLSREEKLAIITRFQNINGIRDAKAWLLIEPNANHDWINQRDPVFEAFVSIGDKSNETNVVFEDYSSGVKTNRDSWCFNFSRATTESAMRRMIDFFNVQVDGFSRVREGVAKSELSELAEAFIDTDPKRISWTREIKQDLIRSKRAKFQILALRTALYRPYTKQHIYFDRQFNNCVYQLPRIFPIPQLPNILICATGGGATKGFSCVATDILPDLEVISKSVCFPLYLYEKEESQEEELISKHQEGDLIDGYRRRPAITNEILAAFRKAYEIKLAREDIFYYVYGILHSPEYRSRFAADLKKMLPRIPLTKEVPDFWRFSKSGRELAHWHLKYETVEPYPLNEIFGELSLDRQKHYRVQKMTFGRKDNAVDKTVIIYNSNLTLTGIPLEAYDYIVNGKPALEWIMERYQITVDKDSGIRNDPNDWMIEHHDPAYLVNLVKRITRVSLETIRIVKSLPSLNESARAL